MPYLALYHEGGAFFLFSRLHSSVLVHLLPSSPWTPSISSPRYPSPMPFSIQFMCFLAQPQVLRMQTAFFPPVAFSRLWQLSGSAKRGQQERMQRPRFYEISQRSTFLCEIRGRNVMVLSPLKQTRLGVCRAVADRCFSQPLRSKVNWWER